MKPPPPPNKMKNGFSCAFPDVCKTPAPPAPFMPVPYPNIAEASKKMKATTVKIKSAKKQFTKLLQGSRSQGDEAGTLKGVISPMNTLSSLFVGHSATIKAVGKKGVRLLDPNAGKKVHKTAQAKQKTFEQKVVTECDKILEATKDDPDASKAAKQFVKDVLKRARGH